MGRWKMMMLWYGIIIKAVIPHSQSEVWYRISRGIGWNKFCQIDFFWLNYVIMFCFIFHVLSGDDYTRQKYSERQCTLKVSSRNHISIPIVKYYAESNTKPIKKCGILILLDGVEKFNSFHLSYGTLFNPIWLLNSKYVWFLKVNATRSCINHKPLVMSGLWDSISRVWIRLSRRVTPALKLNEPYVWSLTLC